MLRAARPRRLQQLRNGISHGPGCVTSGISQRRFLNEYTFEQQHAEPTRGLRLAVKDNFTTASDIPTTCASKILIDYRSPFEATVVQRLRQGDDSAVLASKTNMDEFGMGSHSVNSVFGPVSQDGSDDDGSRLSAGGSSGGSAVAVAEGAADLALGTDTGGSVRLPAAYTGVVGFKPSYGMLSRHGVVPYANSLDTVGLLARTAARIRAAHSRLYDAGGDPKDPTCLAPETWARCEAVREGYTPASRREMERKRAEHEVLDGLTFGLPVEYNIAELEPAIRDAWAEAARKLQRLGARVVPVSLPSTRHALSAYYVIAPAEASSNLAKYDGIRYGRPGVANRSGSDAAGDVLYSETRGGNLGAEVRRRILLGSYTLSSEAMDNYFIRAQKVRRLVQRDFDRVFRLANPLRDPEPFDLSDMDEAVLLESKLGPVEVDFLLCPTAPTRPPTLREVRAQTSVDSYMNDVFTVPASLAGLPAISVPMGVEAEGPVAFAGLQIIGQYWDDARLLHVAEEIQTVLDPETFEKVVQERAQA